MLTYLTKVYPEDSLRYRIYYALRHGKFLGKSYIDRLETKIKENGVYSGYNFSSGIKSLKGTNRSFEAHKF